MKHLIEAPLSLIEALKTFYPDSSKRTLENWIKSERVFIDDKKASRKDTLLVPGQSLTIGAKLRPSLHGLKYLYHDRWVIAIEKPPFLLSVASENPDEENALGLVRDDFQTDQIFPVHRLDRECSGVLIFARGMEACARFDVLFEAHDLTREYTAIIDGHFPTKKGTWRSFLYEKENFDVATTTEGKGKLAITHFDVIRYSKKFTFLKLTLETGRKHQIRVHCKEAGHPIVGDKRYGSLSNPIRRLALHATSLHFIHPFTQKKIALHSRPPF